MACSLNFRPLYGVNSEDALCYVLYIDDCTILLDCGWTEDFQESLLEPLREISPSIDAVLVTHPDILHIGALPFARKHFGLSAPVYGTLPVEKMGQMFLHDSYYNRLDREDFTVYTLDDVDDAFEHFVHLKYSQQQRLEGKHSSVFISPFAAGRFLGGCLWKISKEPENIIYAVDYNHRKERLLDGSVLRMLERPSLLITDSVSMSQITTVPYKEREKELTRYIMETLRGGGNVLLPSDTAGRCLEMLLLLNSFWALNQLFAYPIVFLHNMTYRTIEFAKSQLEWMSESVAKEFDRKRENPFNMKHVKCCHRLEELKDVPQPFVVLCSSHTLQYGPALDLFIALAEHESSSIILTGKSEPNTLGRTLFRERSQNQNVRIQTHRKVPIEGEEYENWRLEQLVQIETEKRLKEEEEERKKLIVLRDEADEGNEDEEEDNDIKETHPRLFLPPHMRYSTPFPMYPFIERAYPLTSYGIPLDPLTIQQMSGMDATSTDIEMKDVDSSPEEVEETPADVLAKMEVPKKVEAFRIDIKVRCKVHFVDFCARPEAQAVKRIIQSVSPTQLVVVHGSEDETKSLVDAMRTHPNIKHVYSPSAGELIDLTQDTGMYSVHIGDDVIGLSGLKMIHGFEIGYCNGVLLDGDRGKVLVKNEDGGHHPSVFIGNMKLSQLRSALEKHGVSSDFIPGTGTLAVQDSVIVRKSSATTVVIEGSISPEYYLVRKLVYNYFVRL